MLPNQAALLQQMGGKPMPVDGGLPAGQSPPFQQVPSAPVDQGALLGGIGTPLPPPDQAKALAGLGTPMGGGAAPDLGAPAAKKTYSGLGGWETDRLNDTSDRSGKYVSQRWFQDNGYGPGGDKAYGADAVRAFMGSDEGKNWEAQDLAGEDPKIRQKQEYLSSFDPGRETRWQDVIRDSGPGGENGFSFANAETRPGEGGYEAPGQGGGSTAARLSALQGGDAGAGLDPLLSGDPFQKIMAALGQHSTGRGNAEALMKKLGV